MFCVLIYRYFQLVLFGGYVLAILVYVILLCDNWLLPGPAIN